MRTTHLKLLSLTIAALFVGGCVASPPRYSDSRYTDSRYSTTRHSDYRYDDARYGSTRYDDSRYGDSRYVDSRYGDDRYADRCQACGTIERIELVWANDSSIGGGSVLGAVIGGVVGNQIGSGSGRQAATVAGAIAGGVIGHQTEQNRRGERQVYRFEVNLDDGRWARVTQRENPGLRVGDRVVIRNQQLSQLR